MSGRVSFLVSFHFSAGVILIDFLSQYSYALGSDRWHVKTTNPSFILGPRERTSFFVFVLLCFALHCSSNHSHENLLPHFKLVWIWSVRWWFTCKKREREVISGFSVSCFMLRKLCCHQHHNIFQLELIQMDLIRLFYSDDYFFFSNKERRKVCCFGILLCEWNAFGNGFDLGALSDCLWIFYVFEWE